MTYHSNIIIQGGLGIRAAEDYQAQKDEREYSAQARKFGVRAMEANDSLLNDQTEEARAGFADRRRDRGNADSYRQIMTAGGSYDDLVAEATKRGDMATATKARDVKRSIEGEGMKDVVTAALGGADAAEIERIYNGSGKTRADPGSVKIDHETGMINFTQEGKPSHINAGKMAELLGIVKRREPKLNVVPPGGQLAVDGKVVATNTAGVEAKSDADRKRLDYEYGLKRDLEGFKRKYGDNAGTALTKNIDYMVSNGVVDSPKEAFEKLRTAVSKPEEDAILSLSTTLTKGSSYRGKDGQARAVQDATAMVRSVKGPKAAPDSVTQPKGSSRYKSAEDVRAAFQAGQLDRQSAIRELGTFGMTP